MKVRVEQITDPRFHLLYLFGEDEDAIAESADHWLAASDEGGMQLRLDLAEITTFEKQLRMPSLLGRQPCRALIRDAHKVNAKQAEYCLQLASAMQQGDGLMLCAVGAMYKKSWHKPWLTHQKVACCEFTPLNAAGFQQWLLHELERRELPVQREDALAMAARLDGLRSEAKQWLQRLQCYQGTSQEVLPLSVMLELSGEYAPSSLEHWCHAASMRQPQAIAMTHQLICHQHISGLQMLAWLDNRLRQLLLFCWHQARRHPEPIKAAGVYGHARASIISAARCWSGSELMAAVSAISETEMQLKGASARGEDEIMEALLMRFCRGERHADG